MSAKASAHVACHCEERSNEAIQLDCHGALRAPRNDKKKNAPRRVAIANHHPRLRLDRREITRAIHVLDAEFSKPKTGNGKSKTPAAPPGELSLVFLPDAALAQLHADFLADPTPTDVITFEGDATLGTAGEICVSADAALRQIAGFAVSVSAGKNSRQPKGGTTNPSLQRTSRLRALSSLLSALNSSSAFSAELTLYVVHGWLHLAGFDDLGPKKKRAMRRAEARALRLLARAGAVPQFTLRGSPPL